MRRFLALAAALLVSAPFSQAQQAPSKYTGDPHDFTIKNFRFGTGETLPELKLHYFTIGTAHKDAQGHVDNAVLLLHGTGGNGANLMAASFSGVLFGPGQPLDSSKYLLIFPDDIGHGHSSKPSDGLKMKFPHYDYDDMVRSQHQMLEEDLNVHHLRLVIGTSMGCMHSFVWGETYPDFVDALMPLACNAMAIAGRNRMTRYMAIEDIKMDPAWMDGNYATEPKYGVRMANEQLLLMGGAPLQLQKNFPTREAAEKYVDNYLDRTGATVDANNMIYYLDASRNYDPSKNLSKIKAPMMWVNSADDFVNPPELGQAQAMIKQVPRGQFFLIPISDATRGHGTHTVAAIWQDHLVELMKESEPKH